MEAMMERRLDRLEVILRPWGCDDCRDWSPITLCDDLGPDGELHCLRPEVCPNCGRTVPIETRVIVAGVAIEHL
jgi:hypothetical protein